MLKSALSAPDDAPYRICWALAVAGLSSDRRHTTTPTRRATVFVIWHPFRKSRERSAEKGSRSIDHTVELCNNESCETLHTAEPCYVASLLDALQRGDVCRSSACAVPARRVTESSERTAHLQSCLRPWRV